MPNFSDKPTSVFEDEDEEQLNAFKVHRPEKKDKILVAVNIISAISWGATLFGLISFFRAVPDTGNEFTKLIARLMDVSDTRKLGWNSDMLMFSFYIFLSSLPVCSIGAIINIVRKKKINKNAIILFSLSALSLIMCMVIQFVFL